MFWVMDVPQVKFAQDHKVTLELIAAEPALFEYLPENNAVYLDDSIKADFVNGLICPSVNEATLTFNLTSDLFGNKTQTLSIPIKRHDVGDVTGGNNGGVSVTNNQANTNNFAGVRINKEQDGDKIVVKVEKEPLKVDKLEITTTGLLTVNFNKPILKPPLKISTDSRRELESSELYDVQDFFSI